MRGDTLVLGATPSFSNVAKSLRFMTLVLTRTFRAHTQIKIWPEVGSGRWLVSESDRDLKKSLFPSVFSLYFWETLRKHLPSVPAPESPLHSPVCLKRTHADLLFLFPTSPLVQINILKNILEAFLKGHHSMCTIYIQPSFLLFPTPNKTIISE